MESRRIFPGFDTLQLCGKVKDLLRELGETPANFTGRILFVLMFNDISCGTKDNEEECLAHARVVSLYARRFGTGHWSFIGLCSVRSRQKILWIVMTQQIKIFCCNKMENELKSCHNKINGVIFCMDTGFLSVDEIGQYLMTKDTGDLTQFHAVACREYTLPREQGASQPRGWIQGNTKIGPVLEVTTSCLHGKYGVENRIWSLNGDNTHSWVKISHGSNKFVMDSNNNDTEALHLNAEEFVSHPKAKAKPQRKEPADSSS